MKKVTIELNSEIRKLFKENSINIHDGVTYLLSLYHNLDPTYFPQEFKTKVLSTNIVTKDYKTNTYIWNIPLFEEQEVGYEWIKDWMDLFKAVNPDRRGTKQDVVIRMKRFFANNPGVSKEDVFKATKLYLVGVSQPLYCKKSHKFIYEQDNSSMLKEYIEKIQENNEIKTQWDEVM